MDALVRLVATAREVLKHVPFEMLTSGLAVLAPIDDDNEPLQEGGATHYNLADLGGPAVAQMTVARSGPTTYRVWNSMRTDVSYNGPHLIYRYVHRQVEEIVIDGVSWVVNDSPWDCGMATPTFSSLESALEQYVRQNRIPEQCGHLAAMWGDDARISLGEKPEHLMRRSLHLALIYALSDATVRPEQNQSETKPVDLEVTWWSDRRAAIVEIKWLGASGQRDESHFKTKYSQSRAVEGMRQLAEYLDLRDSTTSDIPVMGYLFVFDARRRNLAPGQSSISRDDGLYYAQSDPSYPPEIIERADMGRPFRCFMEPVFV
ncbi:hypothetical protein [Cellulomonas sp. PhB143]|uniref:hypothetical protein n=1 Tax=Cellulomonas sp. PhB143 TaxID=2485186 RepID=UPI0011CD8029|nr:hypothetical protein [Cellulomonas sp. PhB143]